MSDSSFPTPPTSDPTTKRTIKIGSQREASETSAPAPEISPQPETMPPVSPSPASPVAKLDAVASSPAEESNDATATASPKVALAAWSTDMDPTSAKFDMPEIPRDVKMSDISLPGKVSIPRKDDVDDDDLAAALGLPSADMSRMLLGESGSNARELQLESRMPASVVKVYRDLVFFVLPGQLEGVCSLRQFAEPPAAGTRMEVVVSGYSAEDGLYELRVPGQAIDVGDWSDLSEGVVVEAKITAHNSGGLECDVNHIRGFIPASQVSLYRIEDFSDYVGQKLQCVVTEANPTRRNLVLSHRAVLERERAEKRQSLLSNLEVGSVHEGVVTNVKDFGAFVDMGGVEGLIHVSQLSWERIRHPKEVVEPGQRVKVRIEKIDPQTGKIGLSYRDLIEHPWQNADAQFPVGGIVTGTVTRIMEFGAFVRVGPGMEGLVHISELSHQRVRRVNQVVQEGQEVQVKILSMDRDAQRMSLSMKAAQKSATPEPEEEAEDEPIMQVVPRVPDESLKGGVNRRTGGENFGLKW